MINEFIFNRDCYKDCENNLTGNKNLVFAIIYQALVEAKGENQSYKTCARRFINHKNDLFRYYCELVDMNPDWLAKKLNKNIEDYDNKKRSRSPYLVSKLKVD